MNKQLLKKSLILTSVFFFTTVPSAFATNLYPDLKTLTPDSIQYDTEDFGGSTHVVLRFGNTVWNAGEGPLEIYGTQTSDDRTRVTQRIYTDEGSSTDSEVGYVVFHDAHNHWHFENFAEYQLWTKDEYDQWVASGRQEQEMRFNGYKTTFCVRETVLVQNLPNTPEQTNTECGQEKQGLAVGWGDKYEYNLPEQWIDLGTSALPDDNYVLRSVADPLNILKESETNDPARESDVANEGVTYFSVHEGEIIPYTETPPTEMPVSPTQTPRAEVEPTPADPVIPDTGYDRSAPYAWDREQLERLRAQLLQIRQNWYGY